ncbi:MAG: exodeoxyribonuclease VII large subunit [Gammaproteobacteria bacterium]|jgi:exodeoxyribonuclease VII large subunit|nr:exodeoxyribonuclease VII large subunit [Gammaproteobacteria bacterium]MDH3756366.1 exodeoxyribonuclease VII large subunit [Gammaproteobacteria bacterium]MDH3847702.1 exodeoxyribonuclease VII large subunit [Gammaproteobacteria bacterium]MDH3863345.1 exodeoxyribonuclease VII large subunit [Gammaproteobacteria bacterium]MDH3905814.1 exodeoxyribonuclease VII large subunit [Gammaproteobacteria bacterium]
MENSGQGTAITVSQLNRQVKTLLERGVGRLWVEGEISNIARPASGHLYFRLKDESAQISAAFFRNRQRGPTHAFKNGDHVLAYGQVGLYEARGDYQLIVEQIEAAGEGVLQRRYEALKKKLTAEGLFDEDRKQAIPSLPRRIGVITSPSGAAVRDVLTVLRRRFPAVPVVIYPAAVQGDAAPGELIAALQTAIRRDECDVLILTRGGGSIEDLWAFNDELLARAIAECPVPVVSAVGHEVDFTIADFVADVRAPTPSGAAELVVPDRGDWLRAINTIATRIARQGQRTLENKAQALDWLSRRLVTASPAARVARQQDSLRETRGRLVAAMRHDLHAHNGQLFTLNRALLQVSPAVRVQRAISRASSLRQQLAAAGRQRISDADHRLRVAARALDAVSPLATLDRGYAIVIDASTGKALTRSSEVKAGDDIRARLAEGELLARITGVFDAKD